MNVFGFEDRRHRSDLVLKPLNFRYILQRPLNVSANACSRTNGMDAELGNGNDSSLLQNAHHQGAVALWLVNSCSNLLADFAGPAPSGAIHETARISRSCQCLVPYAGQLPFL